MGHIGIFWIKLNYIRLHMKLIGSNDRGAKFILLTFGHGNDGVWHIYIYLFIFCKFHRNLRLFSEQGNIAKWAHPRKSKELVQIPPMNFSRRISIQSRPGNRLIPKLKLQLTNLYVLSSRLRPIKGSELASILHISYHSTLSELAYSIQSPTDMPPPVLYLHQPHAHECTETRVPQRIHSIRFTTALIVSWKYS